MESGLIKIGFRAKSFKNSGLNGDTAVIWGGELVGSRSFLGVSGTSGRGFEPRPKWADCLTFPGGFTSLRPLFGCVV